ncbi:response regulator [Pseudodesulfovibrio sp.]|uniref:hybrid sensor histidine kinase/response regulator n=1 Tax=unclassified Pseudodesulfovibrio TaxID=2661612 RepID=UPI003AFF9F6B
MKSDRTSCSGMKSGQTSVADLPDAPKSGAKLPFSDRVQYVGGRYRFRQWWRGRTGSARLAEEIRPYRVLAVDHAEDMLTLYRDVLCYECEDASDLEAFIRDDAPQCFSDEIEPERPVFEVSAVTSGQAAMEAVRNAQAVGCPFAVAFIEIHLEDGQGDMAGLDAAEALHSADPAMELVLLSSRAGVPLRDINRRIRPADKLLYLQKPFRSAELRQIATSLVAKWDTENRLRELNETLVSKVEARTAELNEANRRLRLDIAKRAGVLHELQASEERYRLLFEKDISGNFAADGDGRILDCNAAFARLFGFASPGDADGADVFELWEDMGAPEPLLGLVRRHKRLTNLEVIFSRGPVKRHLITNFDAVVDADNELIEVRGYLFDVTELKRLEEQLRQSQKMEALGTLAGGIAHDFNNILGVIMGYAEIIQNSAESGSGLDRRITEISLAGKRARDLVNQILNFSRQGPQERHTMTLTPLIKEALKLLRSSMPANVELITRIETDQDSVLADPTQMHQILLNLCGNASYAMAETGGTLTVTLADVAEGDPFTPPPELGRPKRFVRLTVADTGAGIAPEVVERVFDPFFTTKRQGEGTGMGLAMVHGIVKRHDGYVELDNRPGEGAAFHVFLPKSSDAGRPTADAAADLVFREGRILFVDDEKPLVDIGRDMLESCGFEVVTRTSSVEALEAFRHRAADFDLVITDQTMPNMTGLELAREILHIRPNMRIILCTGFSDAISYDRLRDIGIGDFIMKPILKRDLIGSISRLLAEG